MTEAPSASGPKRRSLASRLAPLWVLVLALVSFSVGLSELPVQDRDEARYAQASRQMAETGDWVDIRFQDAARHVKPVGVYWMQAAVLELTGTTGTDRIWVHRLPSYLMGALTALALVWAGTPLVGRRAAVLAGVMLATVYMLSAEARTAKTDATLLLAIVLAMGVMARAWLGQVKGPGVPAIFWSALAAGLLVKGPVILLPVLTAAAWVSIKARGVGWAARLRPLPGLAWMLLLTLPWFVAIMLRTDGAFLTASIGGDMAEKLAATGEHSGMPPGLYLAFVWVTFWPWTLLLPLAVVTGWRLRRSDEGAFLLGWIVPTWIVFEAVWTKLIHYTLPVYPALLLLAAIPLAAMLDGTARFRGWAAHVGAAGFALGTVAFAVVAIGAPIAFGDGLAVWPTLGGVALAALALYGTVAFYRDEAARGTAALALAGIVMAWTLTAASLPAAREFWVTPRLAQAMERLSCLSPPPAIAGFSEPSLVFRFGTDTLLTTGAGALAWLAEAPGRAAWIAPGELPEGMSAPEGVPDLTEISGTNYTNGRSLTLRLFVSPGVPAADTPCG
ncbi:glycosyltransferase family 39 protein [Roseibacterium sp. SDUM158017]|uniref:ArnT family glycosyltransferase n=1 Tax=Roseicyclus salinarum TaxID=3036773 RepID=UPI002414F635|nr:glycosyltransferase family 39 protein [Roseibacterium sp. SDUM158017]MDG4647760.1 glycosyltransferase family 39 protein [Roseibacterium sp. SDUM158017]